MISNSIDSESKICPQCELPIPADAPGGICPGCIIDLGLSSHGSPDVAATIDMPKSSSPTAAFIAPSAQDLNDLFEHLEIESLLGQGGMGAVYKARQISLDRYVAVKILPPYSGNDPSFQERFQREARALARLTHPNIVMVFEFGQVSEMYYFVMEYVDGVNLREAIEAGGLTTQESLKVVPQICEALQYAHDEGIVHRDIKPENIILDSKGRIKIADFGLAKLMENNAINFTLTSTNQVLGTVKYMAPEQIESPNQVDHRSDIYSLGVVFYELLTGELPLGRFDPPSASYASNEPLDPVVMRTLEKQPANRFQQASDVKSAVDSVVIDAATLAPSDRPAAVSEEKEFASQKYAQPRTSHRSQSKRLPAVNFQLQKVFAGFGRGKGLMRVDTETEELILDIEIKDFLGGLFRSEFKQVRIGFDHILAFNSEFSWYSTPTLEIQTDYFQEFASLPGAENGKIDLTFNTKDKKAAIAFCEQVSQYIGLSADQTTEEAQLAEEPVDQEVLQQELARPAKGMKIAGIIDLVVAAIAMVVGPIFALTSSHDMEVAPSASMVGIVFACFGIFEIYLSQSARAVFGYWTLVIGSIVVSVLWFHPGALFAIPSAIWLLILIWNKHRRRGFLESEQAQQEHISRRSDVYVDPKVQMDLRKKLKRPVFFLLVSGILSTLMVIGTGVELGESFGSNSGISGGTRTALVHLCVTSFGILSLVGAILLRFYPSVFWARAVSRFCRFPCHILFPINYFIGKRIDSQVTLYETENFSRNPYLEKGEEFTSHK